jgi:superfamily II DNA helicase RecQ
VAARPVRGAKAAKGKGAAVLPADDTLPAATGLSISAGGRAGTVTEICRGAVVVAGPDGEATVEFGTSVSPEGGGSPLRLVAPAERVEAAVAALTAWRLALAKQEGKPPYVYLSNAHLRGIAERDPDTPARLARCPGIGPAKLEAYGDVLLGLLDELGSTSE